MDGLYEKLVLDKNYVCCFITYWSPKLVDDCVVNILLQIQVCIKPSMIRNLYILSVNSVFADKMMRSRLADYWRFSVP